MPGKPGSELVISVNREVGKNILQIHLLHFSPVQSSRPWLLAKIKALLVLLKIEKEAWSILLANDWEMARLHAETLGIHTTTDVLTFDMRDDPGSRRRPDQEGDPIELETVTCLDEARRRARELGHPVRHELLLYCLHSLLHVQGYDDRTAAAARRMHAREDALLEAIGVGRVYSGGRRDSRKRAAR